MKTLARIVLKGIGLVLGLQAITSLIFSGSFLVNAEQVGLGMILAQGLSTLVYLALSAVCLLTPAWLLKVLDFGDDETQTLITFDRATIRAGVALLGLYLAVSSGAGLVSYLLRLAVSLGSHDGFLSQTVGGDVLSQTGPVLTTVLGLFFLFRSRKVSESIMGKEL